MSTEDAEPNVGDADGSADAGVGDADAAAHAKVTTSEIAAIVEGPVGSRRSR